MRTTLAINGLSKLLFGAALTQPYIKVFCNFFSSFVILGQLLPYTEPFSPSQYIDTQTFQGNADDSELFETILSS